MTDQDLQALAKEQGIDASNLLHELREVKLLEAIAADPILSTHLAFKGGTALRLIYGSDRYSSDLDFDRVRNDESDERIFELLRAIVREQELEETDAKLKRNTILINTREKRGQKKLKIEVSLSSKLPQGTVVKNAVTPVYSAPVNVLTYPLSILFSGKILAVLNRKDKTPRDLYDLFWFLSRDVSEDWEYLSLFLNEYGKDRRLLYEKLTDCIEEYSDERIASELCAMLPRGKREWVRENLKDRTKELLELRCRQIENKE